MLNRNLVAQQLSTIPDFCAWSRKFGFIPNTLNDIQIDKTLKYYFAWTMGRPPESPESVKFWEEVSATESGQ